MFGPEDMSRGRFVFMSLLPNIVFGFVPYIVGLMVPSAGWSALQGHCARHCGAGGLLQRIQRPYSGAEGRTDLYVWFQQLVVRCPELPLVIRKEPALSAEKNGLL